MLKLVRTQSGASVLHKRLAPRDQLHNFGVKPLCYEYQCTAKLNACTFVRWMVLCSLKLATGTLACAGWQTFKGPHTPNIFEVRQGRSKASLGLEKQNSKQFQLNKWMHGPGGDGGVPECFESRVLANQTAASLLCMLAVVRLDSETGEGGDVLREVWWNYRRVKSSRNRPTARRSVPLIRSRCCLIQVHLSSVPHKGPTKL